MTEEEYRKWKEAGEKAQWEEVSDAESKAQGQFLAWTGGGNGGLFLEIICRRSIIGDYELIAPGEFKFHELYTSTAYESSKLAAERVAIGLNWPWLYKMAEGLE